MRRLVVGMAIFSIAFVALSWAVADDTDIARKITQKLTHEKETGRLRDFDIKLQVSEGIVLLKGSVASKEQQLRTLDVARNIPGVSQVVNQLDIQSVVAHEDREIANTIADALSKHKMAGRLKGFRISVDVTDGAVTLNGTVADSQQKKLAQEAAANAPGVRGIIDQLVVSGPEPFEDQSVADVPTVAEVPEEVVQPAIPQLEPQPIEVVSVEPKRTVTRPSPTPPQQPTAEFASTTAPTAETPSVENAIYRREAADQAMLDQQIGTELMKQLQEAKQSGQLRGFGIGVHVNQAQVRLKGRVSSLEQQEMAIDLARRVKGVKKVVNELTINEPAPTVATAAPAVQPVAVERGEDLEAVSLMIAQTLGQQLQEQEAMGKLAGCDFDVKVDHATIQLDGYVASAEQGQRLLELARQVPGVRNVTANLDMVPAMAAAMPVSAQAPVYAMPGQGFVPYSGGQMAMGQSMPVNQTPRPLGAARMVAYAGAAAMAAPIMAINQMGGGAPAQLPGPGHAVVPARYDHPNLPGYAWPSYAAHPNYAAVTYPKQYSPSAWPYIGPFYPYPQVPLGWRKVTLKWDDGWWQLNFKSK